MSKIHRHNSLNERLNFKCLINIGENTKYIPICILLNSYRALIFSVFFNDFMSKWYNLDRNAVSLTTTRQAFVQYAIYRTIQNVICDLPHNLEYNVTLRYKVWFILIAEWGLYGNSIIVGFILIAFDIKRDSRTYFIIWIRTDKYYTRRFARVNFNKTREILFQSDINSEKSILDFSTNVWISI